MPSAPAGREVLFEIVRIGAFAKVTAIDPTTGVEISLSAPAQSDDSILRAAGLRKLDYVLAKKAAEKNPKR